MPGPSSVTRTVTASAVTFASRTMCDPAGVCATALPTTFADRLLDQAWRRRAPAAGPAAAECRCAGGRRAAAPHSPRARTISRKSIQSRRSSSAPASMRVIARRLRTISSRSSASVLIWPSRSFFAAGVELVAQLDAGWWRSRGSTPAACGNHARPMRATYCARAPFRSPFWRCTISRASDARSSAAAVCSANVSSRARASESSGGPSFSLATPMTPKRSSCRSSAARSTTG